MVRQQQWEEDMRLLLAATGVGLSLAIMLPTNAKALCVSRSQLSGEWLSDDGGTYRVRRNAGNVIWWVGESSDGGRTFTNVFKGIYDPRTNLITGDWSDVRTNFGRIGSGSLTLQLDGTISPTPPNPPSHVNGFHKVGGTGDGFGGTRWFFHCEDN
jgi:hypothetical protein